MMQKNVHCIWHCAFCQIAACMSNARMSNACSQAAKRQLGLTRKLEGLAGRQSCAVAVAVAGALGTRGKLATSGSPSDLQARSQGPARELRLRLLVKREHDTEALSRLHEVEAVVDRVEGLPVRDVVVELGVAELILRDELRHVARRLPAAKGRAHPLAARHELEGPSLHATSDTRVLTIRACV